MFNSPNQNKYGYPCSVGPQSPQVQMGYLTLLGKDCREEPQCYQIMMTPIDEVNERWEQTKELKRRRQPKERKQGKPSNIFNQNYSLIGSGQWDNLPGGERKDNSEMRRNLRSRAKKDQNNRSHQHRSLPYIHQAKSPTPLSPTLSPTFLSPIKNGVSRKKEQNVDAPLKRHPSKTEANESLPYKQHNISFDFTGDTSAGEDFKNSLGNKVNPQSLRNIKRISKQRRIDRLKLFGSPQESADVESIFSLKKPKGGAEQREISTQYTRLLSQLRKHGYMFNWKPSTKVNV